jgi:hypothetical protein
MVNSSRNHSEGGERGAYLDPSWGRREAEQGGVSGSLSEITSVDVIQCASSAPLSDVVSHDVEGVARSRSESEPRSVDGVEDAASRALPELFAPDIDEYL